MSPAGIALGLSERLGRRHAGDVVRVTGISTDRFRVVGFRPDGSADLAALAPATGYRTVMADRLRKAKAVRA